MKNFLFLIITTCLFVVNGQQCNGLFNESISGQCSAVDDCLGTILATDSCEAGRCCVPDLPKPGPSSCISAAQFDDLYNTSRATFLRSILNYGINQAGVCSNCQAKAAFLAIAATMTNNFQTDEAMGTAAEFAKDDERYGNTQVGDGSRFRRRGLFGLRGRGYYGRLQSLMPQYQTLSNPESAALVANSIEIASQLWKKPDLLTEPPLTQYADGTFYGFSMLWFKLTGGIEQLSDAAKQYSKFLRQLECGGDLYPGQGPVCQFNTTHNGTCTADCIKGLEDAGEYCGCSGPKGAQCQNSPVHVRCCLDSCSQELKMDLGFVLDASGSVTIINYQLQLQFTKDLLRRVNVGRNKTHVAIINYSDRYEILTRLNTDYELAEKLRQVDRATYFSGTTNTALALQEANNVFSYANGLRQPEEGATQVLFVITDGASGDERATLRAASVLKSKGILLVSVGVGTGPKLSELHGMCTPPASENYFAMSNYAALEQKLNQFTSRSCSEPATTTANTTVTSEVGRDKYKFLKVKIVAIGNKILITVKLFNGKVKLFYSFTSRNPKDPSDFDDYEVKENAFYRSLWSKFESDMKSKQNHGKAASDEVTLVIDKPDTDVQFVYVGIKGVEEDNKFEVQFDDCALVDCRSKASSLAMKLSMMLLVICILFSTKVIQ